MWRYQLLDLSEQHVRQLRLLIKLNRAEAHVIVKTDKPWPPEILLHPRQHTAKIARDAIN
ncbi:hypothetical protein KRZ98_18040 [Sphingobium sp. AS12]|uniref:hypothetical protein n=1 Tax=Sphingobium sp. AS12 TaxID=2849495 RepID=UPI001C31B820|nr:hypothetical protein [Sphingobium sp. AS12]MBV2150146.1 hypothetical protein [Sphingobium sp. AS12]